MRIFYSLVKKEKSYYKAPKNIVEKILEKVLLIHGGR